MRSLGVAHVWRLFLVSQPYGPPGGVQSSCLTNMLMFSYIRRSGEGRGQVTFVRAFVSLWRWTPQQHGAGDGPCGGVYVTLFEIVGLMFGRVLCCVQMVQKHSQPLQPSTLRSA